MCANEFLVETETVQNTFSYVEPSLGCLVRNQNWTTPSVSQIDVSGSFWCFVVFDVQPGIFYFVKDQELLPCDNKLALYLPPFSIFETLTFAGPLSWHGFISLMTPPQDLPTQPILVPWTQKSHPKSIQEIWNYIRIHKSSGIEMGRGTRGTSPIALKAKKNIDLNYTEYFKFADLSKTIGVSHEVIDRSFKKTFGLTPQLYRRKLRVSQALVLMVLKGLSVAHVCHEVGFSDLDNFSKQFRKTFLASPSQFRPPKWILDHYVR